MPPANTDNPCDTLRTQQQEKAVAKVGSKVTMKVKLEKGRKKDLRKSTLEWSVKEKKGKERKRALLSMSGEGLKLSPWKFFIAEGPIFVTSLESIDL